MALCCAVVIKSGPSSTEMAGLVSALSQKCDYLWCGPDGWDSKASRAWHVHSTPVCYVVDKDRRVLFCGHPVLQLQEIKRILGVLSPRPETNEVRRAGCAWASRSEEDRKVLLGQFQAALRKVRAGKMLQLVVKSLVNHRSSSTATTSFVLRNTATCSAEQLVRLDNDLEALLADFASVDISKES